MLNASAKKILMVVCLVLVCLIQSSCALVQLPFQAIGATAGLIGNVAGKVVQAGIAAAPAAAPFFL